MGGWTLGGASPRTALGSPDMGASGRRLAHAARPLGTRLDVPSMAITPKRKGWSANSAMRSNLSDEVQRQRCSAQAFSPVLAIKAITITINATRTNPLPCLIAVCAPSTLPTGVAHPERHAQSPIDLTVNPKKKQSPGVGRHVDGSGRGGGVQEIESVDANEQQHQKNCRCPDRRIRRTARLRLCSPRQRRRGGLKTSLAHDERPSPCAIARTATRRPA